MARQSILPGPITSSRLVEFAPEELRTLNTVDPVPHQQINDAPDFEKTNPTLLPEQTLSIGFSTPKPPQSSDLL